MSINLYRRNVGRLDRWIRVTVGSVLLTAGLLLMWLGHDGSSGPTLALLGLAGLMSGVTGRCPLYVPFGISTLCGENRRGEGSAQGPACGARGAVPGGQQEGR